MNLVALALAGSIPIVTVFILMVGLRWSAAKSMGVGWVLATAFGLALWRMDTMWWAAAAVYGALQALEIILIVFGAILLMNHLKGSGAIATIRWHFSQITGDRRVQLLLIGLGFVTLIEGAAGFGTPGALAAPLLIGFGFPPLAAAVFGLYFNAPQPPFGAAGTPVIGGIGAVIDEGVLTAGVEPAVFLNDVTGWTAVLTGMTLVFWGLFGIFLLLFWFGSKDERSFRGAFRGMLGVAPFALLMGGVAGAIQFVVAWFLGPELPNIAAGFVVLGVGIVLVQRRVLIPKQAWNFAERDAWPKRWLAEGRKSGQGKTKNKRNGGEATGEETASADASDEDEAKPGMPVLLAWTPYLLVALVLLVTRWPGLDLAEQLREYSIDVNQILGEELSFSLEYLYLPGIVPFLPVAILTALLHRMKLSAVATAWRDTAAQIVSPAVTLIIAVSMTQVMIQSATNPLDQPGMMDALSQVVAWGAGIALPFVAPWIGTLGAFVTGSSTSSNVLFSVLQHNAARDVGISPTIIVALQNTGSGIGNMLSVLNVAAICGVIGLSGREGDILRKMILPTIVFAVLAGLGGLVLAFVLVELF